MSTMWCKKREAVTPTEKLLALPLCCLFDQTACFFLLFFFIAQFVFYFVLKRVEGSVGMPGSSYQNVRRHTLLLLLLRHE